MRGILKVSILSFLAFLLLTGSAMAINITIWDEDGYQAFGQGGEDGETEPRMINNQSWDLEGFFLEGTTLTMVGGFDFKDGKFYDGHTYTSGDIFIDIDGDAQYGNEEHSRELAPTRANFGYDYVLDLNINGGTFDLYQLSMNSVLGPVIEPLNINESNPWRYISGDVSLGTYGLTYYDFGAGSLGDTHNAVAVDLAWLSDLGYSGFTTHFTMECGNDNLMGRGVLPVPEPATMLLLGCGLVGIATFGRKKLFKDK